MRFPLDSTVLRYVLEVAEAGSIRRAADQLFVSASSINRRILTLEERIGTPLFERRPRGVSPTRAGEIILAAARELDRSIADALSEVATLQGLGAGRVSFGSVPSFSDSIAVPVIGQLRRAHPGISIQYFAGTSSDVVRRLIERKLEFGICWNPPAGTALRQTTRI
jgi:DNA-binding transcriptional LysR family regulator